MCYVLFLLLSSVTLLSGFLILERKHLEIYVLSSIIQCILEYGSVRNHQSVWIYDYDYDYDQMFCNHMQLQYIL
jgi:hypothetical protein